MKRLFSTGLISILLLTAVMSLPVYAQSFQVTPRSTVQWVVPNGDAAQFVMDVSSLVDDPIEITVQTVRINIPTEWELGMCIGSGCYPPTITEAYDSLFPRVIDSLTLDVFPTAVGTGQAAMDISIHGTAELIRVVCTTYSVVGVDQKDIPVGYQISRVYPNPFNSSTKVSFALPHEGNVKLTMFDVIGRKIAERSSHYSSGAQEIALGDWFHSLASGQYFLRLETPQGVKMHRIELVR